MPLQVDESGSRHLGGPEYGHHLQHSVVEAGRQEGAAGPALTAPEVGAAHEAGDVEDDDALQLGQRDTLAVAFKLHTLAEMSAI